MNNRGPIIQIPSQYLKIFWRGNLISCPIVLHSILENQTINWCNVTSFLRNIYYRRINVSAIGQIGDVKWRLTGIAWGVWNNQRRGSLYKGQWLLLQLSLRSKFLLLKTASSLTASLVYVLKPPINLESAIHPCHSATILSRESKRALFYHAKPRNGNHGDEA